MAKKPEELQVWQKAERLARAVFEVTEVHEFAHHPRLSEQLNEAADSILANIAEGFGQTSDKAFARFLAVARGSCNEVRSHLTVAVIRRCLGRDRCIDLQDKAEEISRMLTGLEHYLRKSDRKNRF